MSKNYGELTEVKVTAVAVAGTPQGPIPVAVLEDDRERVLLLVMDGAQASAVQRTLNGESAMLTHNFMLDVLNSLNVRVKNAIIYGITESRFLSKVTLETKEGLKEVQGNAGDVVTLAFIARAPIMVSNEVMDRVSISKKELYNPMEESTEIEGGG